MSLSAPRRAIAFALAACTLLPLAGCETMSNLLKDMDKPSASISNVRFQDISLSDITLLFDVDVNNPYDVPLPLVNVSYGLASKGTNFLDGQADVQGTVPAKGKKTIQLPAKVTFASLLSAVQGVKMGSVVPYSAEMGLAVDAPAVGRLTLPIKKQGELPIPAVPDVSLESVEWKSLTLQNAEAVLKLKVVNNNEFPLDLSKLAYNLTLGDTPIAQTSLTQAAKFSKGGTGTLDIPISLKPSNLGLAAFNMLTGKNASYSLSGNMDVDTPFGAMNMPFSKKGSTKLVQ